MQKYNICQYLFAMLYLKDVVELINCGQTCWGFGYRFSIHRREEKEIIWHTGQNIVADENKLRMIFLPGMSAAYTRC